MSEPKEGDLRVWWIPQVPMKPFCVPVETLQQGKWLCDVLANYDAFQFKHNIKPDYANAGGVNRYESDGEGGFDWFDVDEERDRIDAEVAESEAAKK